MATTLYLRDLASDLALGSQVEKVLSLRRGGASTTKLTNTTSNPPASGVQVTDGAGGAVIEWYTQPLKAVTIAGSITLNIRALESAAQANTGMQVIIERCDSAGNILSTILDSQKGTELSTADAAQNWSSSPTSTALSDGDRLRVRVAGNSAGGNMGNGRTFTISYDGATGGAAGDSFLTFTEAIVPIIAPSAIASAEALGNTIVGPMKPVGITSDEIFGAARIGRNFAVQAVGSAEAIGVARILRYIKPTGIAAAGISYYFQDEFADSSDKRLSTHTPDVGSAWIDDVGDYPLLNSSLGEVNHRLDGPLDYEAHVDVGTTDGIFELELVCSGTTDFSGFWFSLRRASGAGVQDGLYLHLSNQDPSVGVQLRSGDPISGTLVVDGGTVTFNEYHTYKIVLQGSSVELFIDGVSKGTGSDSRTTTFIAIRGDGGSIDQWDASVRYVRVSSSSTNFGAPTLSTGVTTLTIIPGAISSSESIGTAILLPGTVLVLPSGVASAEAIGSAVLYALAKILPSAIGSSESFGTNVVLPGGVTVAVTGIATAETFGAHRLYATFTILPSAVGSAESIGSPTVLPAPVVVQITGISSAEAIGSTTLVAIAQIIAQAIVSGEAVPNPVLLPGGVTVQVSGIATAESLGSVILQHLARILPAGVTSTEAFGTHTLRPGAVIVSPSAVGSSEQFGTHQLYSLATIIASAISSAEQSGNPTILPGFVTVLPNGIATAEQIGSHQLRALATILASAIASGEQLGGATLLPGFVTIAPNGVAGAEQFGTDRLYSLASVLPSGIASGEQAGNPTLLPGVVFISPIGIFSDAQIGDHLFGVLNQIIASSIDSEEAFGLHSLLPGVVFVQPSGVSGGEQVGDARLYGQASILPNAISLGDQLGSPGVIPGTVLIIPNGVGSAEALGSHTIVISVAGELLIIPVGIASEESISGHSLLPGMVQVFVEGVTSEEAFGTDILKSVAFIVPPSVDSEEALGLNLVFPGPVIVQVVSVATGEVIGHLTMSPQQLIATIQFTQSAGFSDTRKSGWATSEDEADTQTDGWPSTQENLVGTRRSN